MPKDKNFDEKLMAEIKAWRIEGGELIVGEGIPRLVLRFSHLAADHLTEVTIIPYSEVATESRNDNGVVRTLTTSTPGIRVEKRNLDLDSKDKDSQH